MNGAQVAQDTSLTIDPDQLHAALQADANYVGRGNSGNYFAGRIDEFRVYNKALSAAEVTALQTDITAGTAPAADTTPPTPSTATWLVSPIVAGDNAITMSANEGTDAGGNGVLYYFRCINDSTHDSGWISESCYTDCNCAVRHDVYLCGQDEGQAREYRHGVHAVSPRQLRPCRYHRAYPQPANILFRAQGDQHYVHIDGRDQGC